MWLAGFLHKDNTQCYKMLGQVFSLINLFLSDIGRSQDSFCSYGWEISSRIWGFQEIVGLCRIYLLTTLLLICINNLPDYDICNIPVFADEATLYCKFTLACDMWQQLKLATESEYDLGDNGVELFILLLKVSLFLVSFIKGGWNCLE